MTRQERIYRQLLGLYPADFRYRYEAEMVTLFRDQLRDEKTAGTAAAGAGLWLRTLVDIAKTAPAEHLRREQYVPKPVDPTSVQVVRATGRSQQAMVGYALTSLPIILIVVAMAVAPWFMDPLFANPPAIAGLPAGVVFLYLSIVWAVLGILVARGARSTARVVLAVVVFTLPSTMAIILGPAMILIIQNLAA